MHQENTLNYRNKNGIPCVEKKKVMINTADAI